MLSLIERLVQVLWWATRLTFNSFRIFRHMSRLFYVAGDPELAKRTLRLYIQVVSKSREASIAEEDTAAGEEGGAFGAGGDVDSDLLWVQTCVLGSRMLSRLALAEEDVGKAIETARARQARFSCRRSRAWTGMTKNWSPACSSRRLSGTSPRLTLVSLPFGRGPPRANPLFQNRTHGHG